MTSMGSPAIRAAIAGLLVMGCVMGIGRFVYTPILPLMIDDGALDPAQAGFVAGANYLGYLLGALAAALPLVTRNRRHWVVTGLIASAATGAAMGLFTSIPAMSALRFLSGMASALAMISATSMVMGIFAEHRRPEFIQLHFSGVGAGIALSAILVSLSASYGFGWQTIWMVSALLAAAMLIPALILMPPAPPHETSAASTPGVAVRSTLPLRLFILGYGFFGFGYVILATFINAMARSEPVLQPLEAWIWLIVGLSGIPSLWIWNRIAATKGAGWAYATACLVQALGVGLSVLVISPVALVVSALLLGGTFMAITAIGLARARLMEAANPASTIALMTASFGVGQMAGPVVAGLLFDRTGDLRLASLMAALALLLAALLAVTAEKVELQAT